MSPAPSRAQLQATGVTIGIDSTPCLFAAQAAVDDAIRRLRDADGLLAAAGDPAVTLAECSALLADNLLRRHGG